MHILWVPEKENEKDDREAIQVVSHKSNGWEFSRAEERRKSSDWKFTQRVNKNKSPSRNVVMRVRTQRIKVNLKCARKKYRLLKKKKHPRLSDLSAATLNATKQ